MLKNIALFLTLLIPTLALAEVEPLGTPSPNVGTITPAAISVSTLTVDTNTLKTSEGKVGIGTSGAPATKLHMSSGTAYIDGTSPTVWLQNDGAGYAPPKVKWKDTYGGGHWSLGPTVNASPDGSLELYDEVYGVTPLTVTKQTGRIGIQTGAAGPATTLDVNGNAQFGSGATKSTFTTTGALTLAKGARVGGTLYSVASTTASPEIAGEFDLYTYTLPANTLSAAGDSLFITCVSSEATGTNNSLLTAYFGSANIGTTATSSGATSWVARGRIFYKTSSTFNSEWFESRAITTADPNERIAITQDGTFDPTIANVISCRGRGNGVAGDVTGVYMKVVYEPAP